MAINSADTNGSSAQSQWLGVVAAGNEPLRLEGKSSNIVWLFPGLFFPHAANKFAKMQNDIKNVHSAKPEQ